VLCTLMKCELQKLWPC